VGTCFLWYRLTWVVPDKWSCVCACVHVCACGCACALEVLYCIVLHRKELFYYRLDKCALSKECGSVLCYFDLLKCVMYDASLYWLKHVDETPSNCQMFIDNGGLSVFLDCFSVSHTCYPASVCLLATNLYYSGRVLFGDLEFRNGNVNWTLLHWQSTSHSFCY